MAAEIDEQPAVLANQQAVALGGIRSVAQKIRDADPRFVVLAARGTSDHAALFAKYLVEVRLGLPCGLASPSTLTGYHAHPRFDRVLWVSVSQSGASPDLVESTAAAASAGALTLAVTNDPASALASASHLHVDIHAGRELSVAATKTYTAQLQAMWLLVDAWAGGDGAGAANVPESIRRVLETCDVGALAARYRFVDRVVTVGRGFSYPTARESALKLMETSYLAAHAFSGADLLHGPLAMIDEDRPVIVVTPAGIGGDLLRPVLARLRDRQADTCLVGDRDLAEEYRVTTHLPIPPMEESLSPIVQIVPLQRLAHHLAVARHHDPDQPRGLSKVTETR
jgi:glucosamine--fructose-6-phosphate aminotransferase (isomerizing)